MRSDINFLFYIYVLIFTAFIYKIVDLQLFGIDLEIMFFNNNVEIHNP